MTFNVTTLRSDNFSNKPYWWPDFGNNCQRHVKWYIHRNKSWLFSYSCYLEENAKWSLQARHYMY